MRHPLSDRKFVRRMHIAAIWVDNGVNVPTTKFDAKLTPNWDPALDWVLERVYNPNQTTDPAYMTRLQFGTQQTDTLIVSPPPSPPLEVWYPIASGWDGKGQALLTPAAGILPQVVAIANGDPFAGITNTGFGWASTGGTKFWQATFAGFERPRRDPGC